MQAADTIIAFVKLNHERLDDVYTWEFSEDATPFDLHLPGGTNRARTIALKKILHERWLVSNFQDKEKIIRWFISEWGGIKTNSAKTITAYANASPQELISRGTIGVASWSKALCIYDPEQYAIFDARVACSINLLQIRAEIRRPSWFPGLSSRNRAIIRANRFLSQEARSSHWQRLPAKDFYRHYLNLLEIVSNQLNGIPMYEIEMLLFSLAEELANKIYPSAQEKT
jgi:hypothetical protein